MFCPKSSSHFPLGALVTFGVNCSCSVTGTLIEETGESLTDFILKEKTEEAKRLLRYSDKSLTAISNYLGFSSQSHFSRVFKKYTQRTPGEYREKYTG